MDNELLNITVKQYRGSGFMTISRYNKSGDLLYIADKESKMITAIDTGNYCIVGSFHGHNGIIWHLDISYNDEILVSCSGDMSLIFWEAKNGNIIRHINENGIPKFITISQNNFVAVYCDPLTKKSKPFIKIYELDNINNEEFESCKQINWEENCKITVMEWLSNELLILGCDDGSLCLMNINDSTIIKKYKFHNDSIKSICFNRDRTEILTASLDSTTKLINITDEWKIVNTLTSSCSINCAIYSYNFRKILLGGGVEAMLVAKTSSNDMNLKLYNVKTLKLTTHISNHFGPIRYIHHSPNSKNFTTASQDGTAKIYVYSDTLTENQSFKYEPFGRACDKSIDELLLKNEEIKLDQVNVKSKNKDENTNIITGLNIPKSTLFTFKNRDKNDIEESEIKEEQQNGKSELTIKVSNLPDNIQLKELYDMFEYFGRIEERGVKLKYFNNDIVAFITFTHKDCCEKAINAMHKKAIEYNILHVDYAKTIKY